MKRDTSTARQISQLLSEGSVKDDNNLRLKSEYFLSFFNFLVAVIVAVVGFFI